MPTNEFAPAVSVPVVNDQMPLAFVIEVPTSAALSNTTMVALAAAFPVRVMLSPAPLGEKLVIVGIGSAEICDGRFDDQWMVGESDLNGLAVTVGRNWRGSLQWIKDQHHILYLAELNGADLSRRSHFCLCGRVPNLGLRPQHKVECAGTFF